MTVPANGQKLMKRVIVDRFGGPEVLRVVEDEVPQHSSSSSAASVARTQQPPKKPLLRANARTAALLAGIQGSADTTEYLNSRSR